MTIVCTGSIAYDYLMSFPGHFKDHIIADRLDSISLSFLVDTLVRQRGGIAPNIAYNLALLGEKPKILGTAGIDFDEYRAWLEEVGVDTSYVKIVPEVYTASFFVNTDRANAQIASFYTGAMAYAKDLSLHEMKPNLPDLVIISANDPAAMDRLVKECTELGVKYLYDPSQQIVRVDPEELRRGVAGAHSLFVNDYEYELLLKHTGMNTEQILEKVDFMCVTLGNDGSLIYADGEQYRISVVPPVEIVEPTGMGDAFRAGFVVGRSAGFGWQTCGQMGALAATYCLEQRGTQNHRYTLPEFIARYRQHFDDQGELNTLITVSE
jgi:adenosine kinase